MAGRYKLTYPLNISRPAAKKDPQIPKDSAVDEETVPRPPELSTGGNTITERPVLVPSKDKEVMQSIGLLRQYLRDTGLNINMNKFTSALLQSSVLPYNPYPGFVRRFSTASEKFHTRRETLLQVQRRISQCPTFVTGSGILSGVKLPNIKLWGLQHVLTAINPKTLNMYRDLVVGVTASQQKITQKVGDNTSIMTTLQGPCIFSGSLFNRIFKVGVCVSVLVRSSSFQAAATDFGKTVLCDIEHILKDTNEQVLFLQLPNISGDGSKKLHWSADDLHSLLSSETSQSRTDLIQVIGDAALQKQNCTLQLLVRCNSDTNMFKTKYIRVEKMYDLMTLLGDASASLTGSKADLYVTTPVYKAIHEGVFIEQSEAELYLSTFKKFSNIGPPLSHNVTSALLTNWQNEVAGRQLESDFLSIIHHLWLIEILQNQAKAAITKNEESLSIQICRVLQGNGYKIENISSLITMLYEITTAKVSETHPQAFSDVFDLCFACAQEYFNESRELTISFAKCTVMQTLSKIQELHREKKFEQLQFPLNFLKAYLKCVSISLVEEAVEEFPRIRNVFSQINKILQIEFGGNLNVDVRPDAFRHSSEAAAYTDIDRKQIDVSVSAANFAAPAKISQQASRMQYCVDMRIDEVWKDFLSNLFILRESLPPNPYPSLVRHLRQASLKVQLSRETNSTIVRKLLSSKPRVHEESLRLYSIPGVQAYGLFSAVSTLNSVGFRQVSAMASSVAISPPTASSGAPPIAAGGFEIRCLMSISGDALLYGSACPYLTTINTEEYCFIKGPKTQESDGILSFAKILLIYLGNMQTQGILTIKAVFSESEIELDDISVAAPRFQNLFSTISSSRVPVILHLLIPLDWRYVSVKKVIHICYIDEMNDNVRFVTEHDTLTPLCQVFLNSHDASEYTRRNSIFKTNKVTLKQAIEKAYQDYNWTRVAHLALCLSLEAENINGLRENELEMAGFSWKLLHSPYGTLLYCMALGSALDKAVMYQLPATSETEINDRLKRMLFGFRNCLHLVLTSQSTMCSKALNPYCQDLLQRVAPSNVTNGTALLISKDKLSTILFYVCNFIKPVADSLAADIFHCLPSLRPFARDSTKVA